MAAKKGTKRAKSEPEVREQLEDSGFPFGLADIKLNKNCLPLVLTRRVIDVGHLTQEHCDEITTLVDLLIMHGKDPITLRIDSPGGNVNAAMVLYDYLRFLSEMHKVTIQTQVVGICYSSAGFLQLAGDLRMSYPNAEFMIHPISQGGLRGVFKSEVEMLRDVDGMRRLTGKIARIYADRTKKPFEFWFKHLTHASRDLYFSPEKAVKLGIL